MSTPMVKLSRDQHIWSFNAEMKPVISVDLGTIVEIETWDCFTGQVQSESDTVEKLDLSRINSATGPIAINGTEPGDLLAVTLIDICRYAVEVKGGEGERDQFFGHFGCVTLT